MASRTLLIYGLVDPRTQAIRYIGKSCSGLARPRRHAPNAKSEDTHKARWVRELARAGLVYVIRVLETCANRKTLVDAEVRWILAGRRLGWPLANRTPGGEGGHETISDETRAKIRAAKLGRARPEIRGRPRPDVAARNRIEQSRETIAKRVASNAGKHQGPGYRHTPEARERIRVASLAREKARREKRRA